MAGSSSWLSRPVGGVTSGTVQAGVAGCFRAPGCVEVVLNKHSELQLVAVSPGGKLEPVFSQPLFSSVRSMSALRFTQVLDHVLLLLDSGSLMVLKYSQVVQRFYIAAEAQLAAGTSADPDYLGARLAVSPQPTAAGDALTVAVAAKRGRIACLTVQLAADGSVQLSSPVVYALPAPRVLGASYTLMKRDMDLGDVIDLVLLPRSNQHGQQQQQQQGQAVEHLAVLSHRPGEAASELVMFSWSGQQEQHLRKLGTVSVHNRAGAFGLGIPLHLSHVPQCPSAVVIAREWGLMLLECSAIMQQAKPGQQVERCYVECTQQLAFLYREQLQPGPHWVRQHHLHCVAAKCVLPSLKQTLMARQRPWQGVGAAVVPGSRACTPAAPQPAADAAAAAVLTQAAAAAVAAAVQADAGQDAAADMRPHAARQQHPAAEGQVGLEQNWPEPLHVDAAGAGQEAVDGAGIRPAPAYAGYGEEAAGLAAAEGFAAADADDMAEDYAEEALAYDEQVSGGEEEGFGGEEEGFDGGEEGFEESEDRFLDAEGDSSLVEAAAAFDTSGTASVSGSELNDEGQEVSPLTGQQQQHGWAGTPPSSLDNEEDRAVVEPTSITAVAWASSARDCSPAAAAAATAAATAAAAALAAGGSSDAVSGLLTAPQSAASPASTPAVAVTDQLLVSTSCGCLLQLRVSLSPANSSMWTPTLFPAGTSKLPFRSNSCINVTGMHKVFEVQLPSVSSRSSGSRMGPLLLPLPQRRLLVAADEQSQLLLLQQQQHPHAYPTALAQGAGVADEGNARQTAAAAAAVAARAESCGCVTAFLADQHPKQPAPTGGAAAAAAGVLQQVRGDTAAAAATADGMDIDADTQPPAAAAVHAVPGSHGHHRQGGGPSRTQLAAGGSGAAGQAPPLYVAADQLQLLGKVGPVVTLPAAPQQQQQPLLVAARAGTEGGLRVLSARGPSTTELLRGPAGMLEGASSMWPLAASPDSSSSCGGGGEHVALVFSFAAGATRALSVGEQFADVTEVLGLQGSESTLLAACVAEGVAVQVTPTGVRLCCMDALLSRSSSDHDWARAWRGSPKSSRSATGGWRQPQSQQPQQLPQQPPQQQGQLRAEAAAAPAAAAAAANSGGARMVQHTSRLANSSGTAAPADADAAMLGGPGATVSGELLKTAAAAAARGPVSGMLHASSSRPGSNSPPFGSPASELGEQQHWRLSPDAQQQHSQQLPQRPTAVVLAAAAAGVVLLYTNTGRLIVLGVSCDLQHSQHHYQQQQRALNLEPLDLNSDDTAAAAAAASAAAAAGAEGACRLASNGSSGSGGSSKKRVRCCWGLFERGSMQVDGQVSCLQVVAAAAAALPASPPGSSGSSGCRHLVFVGRYDGSLQILSLHAGSGSLQSLVTFEQPQLLPLQHLAAVLREAGSGGREAATGPGDALQQLASVPVAVPESCVVLPRRPCHTGSCASAGPAAAAAAVAGVRGVGKRGKGAAAAGGGGAGWGGADDSSSGCLQFFVSYRTGAVVAYRLDLLALCHQQQQQQHASTIVSVAADAAVLRVVSQLWMPCITKLQLLPQLESHHHQQQQQQVLAVGSQVWLLEWDAARQLLTSSVVPSEGQVLLAGGVSLPQAATGSPPGGSGGSSSCAGTSPPLQQQQQQQQQDSGHHIVWVTAGGQLQLLHVCSAQQQQHSSSRHSGSLQVSTWLPCTTVTHLLRHPSTNLLLAACRSLSGPCCDREGSASRDLGSGESEWLQALDPLTGARLAAYLPCRQAGQYITCVATWDTPWRPQTGAGKQGSSSAAEQQEASAAAAAGAAAGAGDVEMGQLAATAAAGGGGAEGRGWSRAGAGRWWQRLRHRRGQTGDADEGHGTTQQQQEGEGEQTQEEQQQQARLGQRTAIGRARRHAAAAAAAGGADGSSSGSEHFFQLGSLLKGLDSPGSGAGVARTHSSGRSSQGSRAVKQRKGPLVLLGTEICGEMDGCAGQVMVLQLMHSSRLNSTSSTAAATAATQAQGAKAPGGHTAAAGSGGSMQGGQEAAADGAAGLAAAGSGSWSMQRVARLRMPDPVSALAAVGEDLLLVATHKVLALYSLRQNVLVKAAYCFTRAPILSLSPAPSVTPAAAAGSSGGRLVLAADAQMGVTVFQINLHTATGQYSLQPVGMHCDVRQVCQVLCLPQALQPAAPAAAVRAAKLAEATSAPLPAAVSGQHAQQRRQQHQHQAAGTGTGRIQQEVVAEHNSSGQPVAVAAGDVAAAEGLTRVQQLLEAGLRGLCLDEDGTVVEVGWAKQRTVPAKWLSTAACVSLGGKAAMGSLHLIGGSMEQQQQRQWRLAELLPGHHAQQDGLPLHWLPVCSAAAVAAAAHGSVVCLQRLPAAEGRLLSALQAELLRHPLTRGLLRGAAEQAQQQAAAAVVDARVFAALFCLPYPAQLLVLQSCALAAGCWPQPGVHLLLDGLRSRLLGCLDGC